MSEYRFKNTDFVIINPKDIKSYYEWKLGKCFVFTDETMKYLGIEKMIPTDREETKNKKEIWAFARFDRNEVHKMFTKEKQYLISTFGRVYNMKSRKMIKQSDSSMYNATSSGERYKRVNVHIYNEYTIYYVHRLLATTFIMKPNKYYDVVNHIDEHPYNNYIWNLEWTDKSGNENMHNTWVKNGTSRVPTKTTWTIEDIREICKMMAEGHKATYIFNTLFEKYPDNPMIQYEKIRTLYKHIKRRGDFHDIALECGVKFNTTGNPDYTKEKGSVEKVNAQNELSNTENNANSVEDKKD